MRHTVRPVHGKCALADSGRAPQSADDDGGRLVASRSQDLVQGGNLVLATNERMQVHGQLSGDRGGRWREAAGWSRLAAFPAQDQLMDALKFRARLNAEVFDDALARQL